MEFWQAVENRRSIRRVGKEIALSFDEVKQTLEDALLYAPTGYNMQAGRLLLLVGQEHERFWEGTLEILKPNLDTAEKLQRTRNKLEGFKGGYGTVLSFEDQEVVERLQQAMPEYADNMAEWSVVGQGMLSYVVWTGLAARGLGVSMQHYNPLVDEMVQANWGVPASWRLMAQLPFGKPLQDAAPRAQQPLAGRLKIQGN